MLILSVTRSLGAVGLPSGAVASKSGDSSAGSIGESFWIGASSGSPKPKVLGKSLGLVLCGGWGLAVATGVAGLATTTGAAGLATTGAVWTGGLLIEFGMDGKIVTLVLGLAGAVGLEAGLLVLACALGCGLTVAATFG